MAAIVKASGIHGPSGGTETLGGGADFNEREILFCGPRKGERDLLKNDRYGFYAAGELRQKRCVEWLVTLDAIVLRAVVVEAVFFAEVLKLRLSRTGAEGAGPRFLFLLCVNWKKAAGEKDDFKKLGHRR